MVLMLPGAPANKARANHPRFLGIALVITSPLCLLFAAPVGAINTGEPFLPGATVSVDNGAPSTLVLPAGPGVAATGYTGSVGQPLFACTAQSCIGGPVPSSVSDWNTFYHVEIGIEITNTWKSFRYGNNVPATMNDVLRHLRDTFATINAVFKRDVGAVLHIKHVRFLDQVSYPPLPGGGVDDSPSYAFWQSNLPSVDFVYRLLAEPGYGGGAGYSLCSAGGGGGHVIYDLGGDPQTHNSSWLSTVDVLGHELSHVFGGNHTDKYSPIIEQCRAGCYAGPEVCPPADEQSWSGYCRFTACGNVGATRFGPMFGPMTRVIRQRILDSAS